MNLPPDFDRAVSIIHQRLADLPHPWAFTGSLGMALQGMDLEIHDIDVQSDRDGVYAIETRLAEFVVRPVVFSGTERIRSHFGGLVVAGVEVDIMGEMQGRPPGEDWAPPPELPSVTRWVTYAGMCLPVLDLEYEYIAYSRMGRAAKAARIRHFLDNAPDPTHG